MRKNYFAHLEALKVEEIKEQYKSLGYREITKKDRLFDIILSNGDHTIAFEIKVVDQSSALPKKDPRIRKLQAEAERLGYEFRLVFAVPPKKIEVEIEDLSEKLSDYLRDEPPSNIHDLSSQSTVDEVVDVEIDKIFVTSEGTRAKGTAYLEIQLNYGSRSDLTTMSFSAPMKFHVELDNELNIESLDVDVDTSGFYE